MLRQEDLYHLYAGIREQLHSIVRAEDTGDPGRQAIRREMAEELLDHIYTSEEGLKTQHHYKEQWTGGVDEA